jgi:hypothetical protein
MSGDRSIAGHAHSSSHRFDARDIQAHHTCRHTTDAFNGIRMTGKGTLLIIFTAFSDAS